MAQLLTQKEFAEQLGVSTAYISSLVKQGKLSLENGRLSTKSLISMRGDILRHYNNYGTLIIYMNDTIDTDILINSYIGYCEKNTGSSPENIDNPVSYINSILSDSSLDVENDEAVIELSKVIAGDKLTKFVGDYISVAKKYFISITTSDSPIRLLPASLLYNYILYGNFGLDSSFVNEKHQEYLEEYKTFLSEIDSYMSKHIYDLVWKHYIVSRLNVSQLDVAKYSLLHRSNITPELLSINNEMLYKIIDTKSKDKDSLDEYAKYLDNLISTLSKVVPINSSNNKCFNKLQFKNLKTDIKNTAKHGYFSCYSISNLSLIENLISEDYYKHIFVVGDEAAFNVSLGDKCATILALIKALKIDIKFVDSFN